MTTGTEIKCMTDQDMLEFMRWIRERGGEVYCEDYEFRILKVIRGTKDEKNNQLFNRDGVLGAVNTDDSTGKDPEQEGRSKLLWPAEGNLLQPEHETDLRTS